MNVKPLLLAVAIATSTMFIPVSSMAHSMLEKSSPTKGEVLKAAPKQITLEFGHPTKLTQFNLISLDKANAKIPLTIDLKAAAATTFAIPVPLLGKGKYQVKWGTLSEDGHVMTGTLPFTVSGQ